MASLHPHLLYEAVDIAFAKAHAYFKDQEYLDLSERSFWKLTEPNDTCAFAISSSHAYKLIAYILQRYATAVSVKDSVIQCGTPCFHYTVSVLSFSRQYYITQLVELAGCFCTIFENSSGFGKGAHFSTFLGALAFNNVCGHYGLNRPNVAPHFTICLAGIKDYWTIDQLTSTLKNSKVTSSLRFVRQDGVIRFFAVNGIKRPVNKDAFGFLSNLKIETLHILSLVRFAFHEIEPVISFDIFYRNQPQLQYLKNFRCDFQIYYGTVLVMLRRYKFQNIRMNNVRLRDYTQSYDVKIVHARTAVDALWKEMQQYNGNVYVDCRSYQSIKSDWEAAVETVKAEMTDYDISEKDSGDIILKLERNCGAKRMLVEIVFYKYGRYRCRASYEVRKRQHELYQYQY
uniref:H15 domain-containing protein n=1 Tax=Panagrellus redivivus TaxID=6233 RepID=A0A7E4VBY4_PANRE